MELDLEGMVHIRGPLLRKDLREPQGALQIHYASLRSG
jgi:hypothetical protein